jgi:hypothetical protein
VLFIYRIEFLENDLSEQIKERCQNSSDSGDQACDTQKRDFWRKIELKGKERLRQSSFQGRTSIHCPKCRIHKKQKQNWVY